MREDIPFCGEVVDGIHRLIVRVYFADTDFSGVVYHGRYLEFFERGRTEFLRLSGIHHNELAKGIDKQKLAWIVRRMEIDFRKPAHIDDVLCVQTAINTASGARITMNQQIFCADTLLVSAKVEAALINEQGRPCRFPKEFTEKWMMPES